VKGNRGIYLLVVAGMAANLLSGCGPTVRPYFVRSAGGYVTPNASFTPTARPPAIAGFGQEAGRLRKVAESYLGVPYDFGGQSRSGIDCSGFVRQVFLETYGIRLPHNSSAMSRLGTEVDKEELKPGDIVFFKRFGFIDHSGIYMGSRYFIHSSSSVGVAYSTLDAPYFRSHYALARRMPGIN
jgi:cell wall-associated NlpC family hydrolase